MRTDVEVYGILPSRTAAQAVAFLNGFLPNRRPLSDEYAFPEYSHPPKQLFANVERLLEVLEARPEEQYSIYWEDISGDGPKQAMLFFLSDGTLVAGGVVPFEDVNTTLATFRTRFGVEHYYTTENEVPPDTRSKFMERSSRT